METEQSGKKADGEKPFPVSDVQVRQLRESTQADRPSSNIQISRFVLCFLLVSAVTIADNLIFRQELWLPQALSTALGAAAGIVFLDPLFLGRLRR